MRHFAATLSPQYRFHGKFDAKIAVAPRSPPSVIIIPDNDLFVGTIDMLEVYKFLVVNKIITGEEYIRTVEFGAEPQGNVPPPHTGSLVTKLLNYTWVR